MTLRHRALTFNLDNDPNDPLASGLPSAMTSACGLWGVTYEFGVSLTPALYFRHKKSPTALRHRALSIQS